MPKKIRRASATTRERLLLIHAADDDEELLRKEEAVEDFLLWSQLTLPSAAARQLAAAVAERCDYATRAEAVADSYFQLGGRNFFDL